MSREDLIIAINSTYLLVYGTEFPDNLTFWSYSQLDSAYVSLLGDYDSL